MEDQDKELLLNDGKHRENFDSRTNFMYFATFVSAFACFTSGYDTGIISGSMVLITEQFSLTYLEQELLVSLAVGPAIIGAFFSGYFCESIGRKMTLLLTSVVCTVGALVMACAPSKEVLLLGRLFIGLAIGLTTVSSTLYISESAPVSIRGRMVALGALFITGSQFIAALVSGIFSGNKDTGWRYMLGIGAVPSLVLFLGVLMVPESPRWLISKGRMDDAIRVVQRLRGSENVENEVNEIKRRHELSKQEGSTWTILFRMIKTPAMRKALLVSCGIMAIQQLSAINTVMYYTATIIKMAGVQDDRTAIWFAATIPLANFLFTLVGFVLVERIGRRKLILCSVAGVFTFLGLLAIVFHLQVEYSPKVTMNPGKYLPSDPCSSLRTCDQCLRHTSCGFCYHVIDRTFQNTSCVSVTKGLKPVNVSSCGTNFELTNYSCPSDFAWLVILAMLLYLACFSPGLGPVSFIIPSEIFPLWARTTGMACAVETYYFFNLLMSMTFLHGSELLTKSGWFGMSAGFCILGWMFIYFLLPETKGKRLEHMHELFEENAR